MEPTAPREARALRKNQGNATRPITLTCIRPERPTLSSDIKARSRAHGERARRGTAKSHIVRVGSGCQRARPLPTYGSTIECWRRAFRDYADSDENEHPAGDHIADVPGRAHAAVDCICDFGARASGSSSERVFPIQALEENNGAGDDEYNSDNGLHK